MRFSYCNKWFGRFATWTGAVLTELLIFLIEQREYPSNSLLYHTILILAAMEKRQDLPSLAVQALQAHNSNKTSAPGLDQVPKRTEDIKSLNQLLQWATAHSTEDGGSKDEVTEKSELKPEDREWLDAAFPDMYAGIREIVAELEDNKQLTSEERVNMLEDMQEYFLDLNYAQNIDKIGALQPILNIAEQSDDVGDRERATAIWILGTCMQNLDEVKQLFIKRGVHSIIADALGTNQPSVVRAKGVMAASALLNHPSQSIVDAFHSVNGFKALRERLADCNPQTRRRAHFFLQHAPNSGNRQFVDDLIHDRVAVAAFVATFSDMDADDFGQVEAAVGALSVLIDSHSQSLLQVAPELPGIIDDLCSRCTEEDLVQLIQGVSDKLP